MWNLILDILGLLVSLSLPWAVFSGPHWPISSGNVCWSTAYTGHLVQAHEFRGRQHCNFCAQLGHQMVAKAENTGSWVLSPHKAVSLGDLLSSHHAPKTFNLASHGTPGPLSSCSSEDCPTSVMGCIVLEIGMLKSSPQNDLTWK